MGDTTPRLNLESTLPEHRNQVMRIVGRNTLWLLLDRAGLKVGNMLAGLVLIGYLGPANLGVYSTALAIGALLSTAIDLGLTRYAAHMVAAIPQEATPILAITLTTTTLTSAIELVVLVALHQSGHWYATCICLGCILTNIESTSSLITGILSANLRSRAVLPGSVVNTIGVIATVGLVISLKWSVIGLFLGLIAKSLAALIVRLLQVKSMWPMELRSFQLDVFAGLLKSSWPYFSYSLTQIGYEKVATVCLGLVASYESVGLFSAALALASVFPSFTYAASDALLPVMTRLYVSERNGDLLELRRRLMDLLIYLCVPVSIALAVFAPQLCSLLGPKFTASAPFLRIMAARSLLLALDNYLGQAGLTAIARVRDRRNAQALGLIVCAVLTLTMGAVWGVYGAVLATLMADIFILARYIVVFSRAGLAVECPGAKSSVVAGGVMALLCFAVPGIPWPLRAFLAMIGYGAVLGLIARDRLLETAQTFKHSFVK